MRAVPEGLCQKRCLKIVIKNTFMIKIGLKALISLMKVGKMIVEIVLD